jgi:hypothetical protein
VIARVAGVQTGPGAMIMDARRLSRGKIVASGITVIGAASYLSGRAGARDMADIIQVDDVDQRFRDFLAPGELIRG